MTAVSITLGPQQKNIILTNDCKLISYNPILFRCSRKYPLKMSTYKSISLIIIENECLLF